MSKKKAILLVCGEVKDDLIERVALLEDDEFVRIVPLLSLMWGRDPQG